MLRDEITETGTEGNVAVITCPYGQGYESYTKYFCKATYRDCETLIKSNRKDSWTYKDRLSLNDNIEQKKLVVTISDLRMENSGNYGCGIEVTGYDPFTLVHLKVNKAVVSGMLHYETTETETEGNVAVITCPYGQGYESYTKYFCKGTYKDCVTLIKTNGKDSWTHKDRISMNDDTEQKKLIVTISDLRMEDAGQYGCGIERIGYDPFTQVYLKVNKAPKPPKSTQTKPSQSSPPPATKNNDSPAPTLSTNKTEGEFYMISSIFNCAQGSRGQSRGHNQMLQ
ncbi:hypothetical protein MHYP_G00101620 [Metynnis hypsauchen]